MPEKIKKELDEWEEKTKNVIKKLKKAPKKVSNELRDDAKGLAKAGKNLVKKIDKRMDEVEDKSKELLKQLRARTKKAYKAMRKGWQEATEEDYIEPLE